METPMPKRGDGITSGLILSTVVLGRTTRAMCVLRRRLASLVQFVMKEPRLPAIRKVTRICSSLSIPAKGSFGWLWIGMTGILASSFLILAIGILVER